LESVRELLLKNLKYLIKSRDVNQTELAERTGVTKGAVLSHLS